MEQTNQCPVQATMELIGGKYKALILWNLADGTMRYSQLSKAVNGATAKMLTQQLRELEKHHLIHRQVYPVVPPHVEYSLTELGRSLIPLLVSMRDWGVQYQRSMNQESLCFMASQNPLAQKDSHNDSSCNSPNL